MSSYNQKIYLNNQISGSSGKTLQEIWDDTSGKYHVNFRVEPHGTASCDDLLFVDGEITYGNFTKNGNDEFVVPRKDINIVNEDISLQGLIVLNEDYIIISARQAVDVKETKTYINDGWFDDWVNVE